MSLAYLGSHHADLISAISSADWSTIVSQTLAEEGFANPYGFNYARKLHELMRAMAYGAGVHIDRGPWIAAHRDRLLPVFRHIVDTTMAALDARIVAEKPSNMTVARVERLIAEKLYEDDRWPEICDIEVHNNLVRNLRAVIDYAADGPGASGCGQGDDPAEWLAKAKAWTAAITIDEDPNNVVIARFGNGFRAVLLCRPETIRAQSHAMGVALLTFGHPLHGRTSTNLMRQFSLLDAHNRPIATLYADDGCLATAEIGADFPTDVSIDQIKIVVSSIARILETAHGIHDLEHSYRQIVADGKYSLCFRVPDPEQYDDHRWLTTVQFRDGMVQNKDNHAVQIIKQIFQYGDYSTLHSIEYYRNNLRHRDDKPAVFSERTVEWYIDGLKTAEIDTAEYYEKARSLAG